MGLGYAALCGNVAVAPPFLLGWSTIEPSLFPVFIHFSCVLYVLPRWCATMAEKIMLSEAEPALLTELCATLMREDTTTTTTTTKDKDNVRRNTTSTATATRAAPKARSLQQQQRTTRATTSASCAQRRQQTVAGVGTAGANGAGARGPLGSRSANANDGGCAAMNSSTGAGGRRGGSPSEGPRQSNKGRRLDGTPTKPAGGSGGGGRSGSGAACKSTRKESPKKGVRAPREMPLSEDQQRAVDLVADGKSVFFTGKREVEGGKGSRGGWVFERRDGGVWKSEVSFRELVGSNRHRNARAQRQGRRAVVHATTNTINNFPHIRTPRQQNVWYKARFSFLPSSTSHNFFFLACLALFIV